MIGAIELVRDKSTCEPFDTQEGVGAHLAGRAQKNGLITRDLGDTPAFSPPRVIEKDQIRRMMNTVETSLEETMSWLCS